MHVIIDTNIFVSGLLNKKGAPGQIINALLQGDIIEKIGVGVKITPTLM